MVFILAWDLQWSQERLETMLMQNLEGQTKSIMVFLRVALTTEMHLFFSLRKIFSLIKLLREILM